MANPSPGIEFRSLRPNGDEVIQRRLHQAQGRVAAFGQHYGPIALKLAAYGAFPLTLTSDLLYCLRENFVPDCPWYGVADVLLSGLCKPVAYDLYGMAGETRYALLCHLKDSVGASALDSLQNFMVAYLEHQLHIEQVDRFEDLRMVADCPEWTALACLHPNEAVQQIEQYLQRIAEQDDAQTRFQWAALVEDYADLLSERGFRPLLLDWSQRLEAGEKFQDRATALANGLGVELEWFDFETAKLGPGSAPDDALHPFTFTTVKVDRRGQIIASPERQAFQMVEPLGKDAPPLEMVAIPGGPFTMGSPPTEADRHGDEGPQHRVVVPPFFLGKYPITQAQWRFVAGLPQLDRELKSNPSRFQGDDRPVDSINWFEAVEFCGRLSQWTGRDYRLPSEAEWEYACRAGTTTPFSFGETISPELANYDGSDTYGDGPQGEDRGETTPVGQFPANDFGLYDMHGNAWEWCLDDWHVNYEGAPEDGRAWLDEKEIDENSSKLLRGGSWDTPPRLCRSAFRHSPLAGDLIISFVGLRVVCVSARTLP